eukprot:1189772-Prorocentrum_minimum.AAC.1
MGGMGGTSREIGGRSNRGSGSPRRGEDGGSGRRRSSDAQGSPHGEGERGSPPRAGSASPLRQGSGRREGQGGVVTQVGSPARGGTKKDSRSLSFAVETPRAVTHIRGT